MGKGNLVHEKVRNIFCHSLHACTGYTGALYSKFGLYNFFFPSANTPHNFSFLHLEQVCIRSQIASDQVKEEPALKWLRPVEGHTRRHNY